MSSRRCNQHNTLELYCPALEIQVVNAAKLGINFPNTDDGVPPR